MKLAFLLPTKKKGFLDDDEAPAEKSYGGGDASGSEEEEEVESDGAGDEVLQMAEKALQDPKALLALIDARVKACMAAGKME